MISTSNEQEQHSDEGMPPEVEALGQKLQDAKAALIKELAENRMGGTLALEDMIRSGVVAMVERDDLEIVTFFGATLVTFSPIRPGVPGGGKYLVESAMGHCFHVRYCLPH